MSAAEADDETSEEGEGRGKKRRRRGSGMIGYQEGEEEDRGNIESRRQNERPSSEGRGSPRKPKRRGILSFPSNLLSRYLWLLAAPSLRPSREDLMRVMTISVIVGVTGLPDTQAF